MRHVVALVLASAAFAAPALAARGEEHWAAVSTTATGITGDIVLSPTKLVAAGKTFPLAVAADIRAFPTTLDGPQPARVLRVTTRRDPVLLHGNHLCGAPVRWISVYRGNGGKALNMAAFTSAAQPKGESDPGLCATFLYTR